MTHTAVGEGMEGGVSHVKYLFMTHILSIKNVLCGRIYVGTTVTFSSIENVLICKN